jgi:hypothetical protein
MSQDESLSKKLSPSPAAVVPVAGSEGKSNNADRVKTERPATLAEVRAWDLAARDFHQEHGAKSSHLAKIEENILSDADILVLVLAFQQKFQKGYTDFLKTLHSDDYLVNFFIDVLGCVDGDIEDETTPYGLNVANTIALMKLGRQFFQLPSLPFDQDTLNDCTESFNGLLNVVSNLPEFLELQSMNPLPLFHQNNDRDEAKVKCIPPPEKREERVESILLSDEDAGTATTTTRKRQLEMTKSLSSLLLITTGQHMNVWNQ